MKMIRCLTFLFTAAALLCTQSARASQLVQNGGFEDPVGRDCGFYNGLVSTMDDGKGPNNWVELDGTEPKLFQDVGSPYGEHGIISARLGSGYDSCKDGGYNWFPANGSTWGVSIQGYSGAYNGGKQDLGAIVAGTKYTVSADFTKNSSCDTAQYDFFLMDGTDNTALAGIDEVTGGVPPCGSWTNLGFTYTATSGVNGHELWVVFRGRIAGDATRTGIDNVSVDTSIVIFYVGGQGTIGDSTLTNVAGVATLPIAGGYWAAAGVQDANQAENLSDLTSPTLTVANTGTVTLKFKHRYSFEDGCDGGAVYVSVNGATPVYLDGNAFSTNSYNGDASGCGLLGNQPCFTGTSAGHDAGTAIESVATLGSFNAGDKIAIIFRGAWDWGYSPTPPPSWEVRTVEMSDSGGTLLNVDFLNGPADFTVANDPTDIQGPWLYRNALINQFELNATAKTSDKFVLDVTPATIDLTGAKLAVSVLTGTLASNDTYTLFDLSGGSTLSGNYASLTIPLDGRWDVTGLQPGGNGQITYLGPPVTVPPGLNPGDQYRLVFVTSTGGSSYPTNISFYNTFVANVAATVPALNSLGTTWTCIGSTATVDADANTLTRGSDLSCPIYTLDGTQVATGNADLWDGSIASPIAYTESGNLLDTAVWTGTPANGVRPGEHYLGDAGGGYRYYGESTKTGHGGGGNGWTDNLGLQKYGPPDPLLLPFYAMSGVLTFEAGPSTNCDMTSFVWGSYTGVFADVTNITLTVPYGTTITNLNPTYTISANATGAPPSGTTRNFTTPQTYTVTAQAGNSKTYQVTVHAGPITVPSGLNPGDQYRLVFVTSTEIYGKAAAGGPTSIAGYNDFATTAATNVAALYALGTTWKAIVSFRNADNSTVTATSNTGTGSGAGVPLYNLAGLRVASGNTQLWGNNSLDNPINVTELGGAPTHMESGGYTVWTGMTDGGGASGDWSLGYPTGGYIFTGDPTTTAVNFVNNAPPSWQSQLGPGDPNNYQWHTMPIYGMSGILTVPFPPAELSNAPVVTATGLVSQVDLSWTAVTNATGYIVQRSLSEIGGYSEIAWLGTTNYADTTAVNGYLYWYSVAATNSSNSTNSEPVSARPLPAAAPQPEFQAGSAGFGMDPVTGDARLKIANAMGGLKYRIEYTDDLLSGVWTALDWQICTNNGTGLMTLLDTTAPGATQRFYRVEAQLP